MSHNLRATFLATQYFQVYFKLKLMAQVGGIFALNQVEEPHLYSTYFMKIDKVKFKQMVKPGDTIVFDFSTTLSYKKRPSKHGRNRICKWFNL